MSGIKPKVVSQGKTFDENVQRYIFYPLSNLDFAATQFMSPVWSPKIQRGRITLLEPLEYMTQVQDAGEHEVGGNGIALGEKKMGTDAQVKFLMGNAEGTGYFDKGMTHLESIIGLDPETASQIEELIIPNEQVPENLIRFQVHLANLDLSGDDIVLEAARNIVQEMIGGIQRATNYCRTYTNQLEQELRDGQNGGVGLKYLSESLKYYFHQIEKSLPEDRVGTNMGAELTKALAPLLQNVQPPPSTDNLASMVEMEELRARNAALELDNTEKTEIIEAFSESTKPEKS